MKRFILIAVLVSYLPQWSFKCTEEYTVEEFPGTYTTGVPSVCTRYTLDTNVRPDMTVDFNQDGSTYYPQEAL